MSEQHVERATASTAETVVVSYPSDLSTWGRQQLDTRHFRAWLRKTLDAGEVGTTREEFVGVGCCGNTLDVPLRIEAVEGGDRIGESTSIEYVERAACDLDGGWRVQSEDGPNESGAR